MPSMLVLVSPRLGEAIRRRRFELDMSQEDVASAAGLSAKTIWRIEHGEGREPELRTIWKIERALRWPSGTIERLLADGEDPPTDPPLGVAEVIAARTTAGRPLTPEQQADLARMFASWDD